MSKRKVIVTIAPTGGMAQKSQNPNLPTQPAEIAESVYRACKEGAAIAARLTEQAAAARIVWIAGNHDGLTAGAWQYKPVNIKPEDMPVDVEDPSIRCMPTAQPSASCTSLSGFAG